MKLSNNDLIKVVAPSCSIEKEDLVELNNGKKFVESLGLKISLDSRIDSNDIKVKINSLNEALKSNAKLVIAACGGEGAINVIKCIKIDKVKVPVMGFSDITSILNYIYLEKGIITYHGCNLKTFGREGERKIDKKCFDDFKEAFFNEKYLIEKEEFKVIKEGNAEGTLIGGNLTCFLQLAKIYEIDLKDKILLIEDLGYETNAKMFAENFNKLKKVKNFNLLKGIILGNYEVETKEKIEDIYLENIDLNIPVIKTDSIGHGKTNLIVPIGKKVKISNNKIKIM